VLDRGDFGTVLFQAGRQSRIADTKRVGLEVDRWIQIDAAEHDSGIGLRRAQRERNLDAGMETHAGGLDD